VDAPPRRLRPGPVQRRLMTERIHLSKPDITELEEQLVLEALRSGWVAPLGPMVDRFEAEVAQRVGVAGALALSSGTAALHLALLHLGARPGRVVVLPTMTFAASANAVVYTGAEPVFVDADPRDGNVDPGLLLEAVDTLTAEGRDICAVMTVDLFGRAADYEAIAPALSQRGIPLLEDAAEALGASRHGRAAGSFGRAAALSFNGNKILTTSGGGMLLSDDLELLARARHLSTQARDVAPWYEHSEIGYNYRLSNLLAALGVAQLSRLDEMISRRREIRDRYEAALTDLPGLEVIGRSDGLDDSQDNQWLTCVRLPEDAFPDSVVADLQKQDIEARHLWKPMHLQPAHRDRRMFRTGGSEELFARGVTLPSGSGLTDKEVGRVITAVRVSASSDLPVGSSASA
jgi:dTDP-4-amino-4,6-dideoxygalactose transaminase